MDKVRISKSSLYKYLRVRYPNRFSQIVLHLFKFPSNFDLDEYCELIQDWVFQEDSEKLKLGFMIHDMDCDGHISPQDLVDFQMKFCSETNYLIPYDIHEINKHLMAKMDAEPKETFSTTAEGILAEALKKVEYVERKQLDLAYDDNSSLAEANPKVA